MGTTALFGGSFDPVHAGHLAVARQVLDLFAVDRLWFIPAKISPLKACGMAASDEDRLAMLRLVAAGEPRFGVSDCELRRGGVSFTVDTLRRWRASHPGDELLFVAGMDSLLTLSRWRDCLAITRLCRFVTFARPGCERPRPEELGLPPDVSAKLLADIFDGDPHDVSSSEVRASLAAGRGVEGLVPPPVLRYIVSRGLYCGRPDRGAGGAG